MATAVLTPSFNYPKGLFVPKGTDETWTLTFDFADRLGAGETIVSAPWTASVLTGTDPDPDALLENGGDAPTIIGSQVVQRVVGGVDRVTYCLNCLALTSSGQVLRGRGHLEVRDAC
jgi:hypothetical protein